MSDAITTRYEPTEQTTREALRNRFLHHAPKNDQAPRYEAIREGCLALAEGIVQYTPPSREQSLALTHLETAMMFANAAIARNE